MSIIRETESERRVWQENLHYSIATFEKEHQKTIQDETP